MRAGHILAVLCLVFLRNQASGLRCNKCSGVTDPKYCAMTVTCKTGEECYTEQMLGEGSDVFYNSGCQDVKICQALANSRRSQLHICEGCCATDLCNSHSCSHSNVTTTPGSTCFKCDEVDSPLDCHTRSACAQGEQCIVTKFLNVQLETKFKLGCETKQRCDIIQRNARRDIEICNECCHSPGCNRHLCIADGNMTKPSPAPTNSSCADSPEVNCTMFDQTTKMCALNTVAARTLCPRFCGICLPDGSTRPSTTPGTPPTGTTEDPCKDKSGFDCKGFDASLHICANKTSPPTIMYCPKFCGIC